MHIYGDSRFDKSNAMYLSLPANTIKDRVNKAYYSKSDAKGTELTAAIMRTAHSSKSEKVVIRKEIISY